VPDRVIKVRFSPDGKRIVVVRQAVIEQWRIADGVRERNYRVLNFENGGVNFSRDGRRLVSFYRAGRDYERVHIWNTEDGTLVRDIDEHGVQSAWLPGPGNELVVIGHDGVMRVWDVARGVRLSSTQVGVPDGASSLTDDDKSVVAVSGRTQVSVWDWAHATRVATLEHGARLSQWPDWTEAPDAAHITTCGGGASTKLWDATTRKMRASFDATTAGEVVFCRYVGADTVIATTDDGYVYAASAVDGNVRISTKVAEGPNFTLPLADGVRMAVVSIGRYDRYSLRDLRTGTVYATLDGTEIDLSADKRLLALAQQDGSVELVRGTTGRMLRRFLIDEHPGEKVVAVTQDMTRAVTSGVDDVWSLWNLDSGERVPIPPLRSKSPMALSGDGTVMIGCLDDATVLLDTSTGQIISRLPVMVDANDFALDEHAHRLAVVSRTGPTKVWDLQAQRLVKTVPGTGANVAAMLDPGGRWLVTWEPFKSSRLQDLDSGGAPMHLLDSTFLVFGFSQDGTRLALGDDDNHTILVETAGGKHLFEGEGLGFLDRTGAHITTATTGLVQVHDVAAPTHPVGIPLTAAFRCAVALTPDATLVAGASGVWSAYDGRALATFAAATVRGNDRVPGQEHTGGYEIGWMVMSRDGRAAADVAPNSGVTVWDLSLEDRSPQEIARFVSAHVPWRVDGGRVVPVPSPTVRLRGRLTSHGKPIAAEVRVEYTNYAARSSANGDYAIENMLPGAVDVYGVTEDRSLYTGPHHVVLQPGDNTLDIDLAR
jgi:WD40 repeat protein